MFRLYWQVADLEMTHLLQFESADEMKRLADFDGTENKSMRISTWKLQRQLSSKQGQ